MSLISPIYQGNHSRPANKNAFRVMSRIRRKKRRLDERALEKRNNRIHRSVEFQRRIAIDILGRLSAPSR